MSSMFLDQVRQRELVAGLNQLKAYMVENFSCYNNFFPDELDNEIKSLNELAKYPLLDKKHPVAQALADEVLERNPVAYFETSGTSGAPFPVIPDLQQKRSVEFASFISEWLSLKNKPISRAAIALPFEMNPIGLKYFLALKELNIMSIPVGVRTHLCPPSKVLDIFERLNPELLVARPMETLRYAEVMMENGVDPAKCSIKKIILTGEIISPAKFERISRYYGNAEVYSVYGLTELDSGGLVSCKKHQYHLPTIPYIAIELLEDDFKTPITEDGKMGNIIFTNTHKNLMPIFRYKTGDYGTLQKSCSCNQFDTPVINLLGRSSDKITLGNETVFPIQIENILFQYDEIASDYLIIKTEDNLSLRLEWMLETFDKANVSQFIELLRRNIKQTLNISIQNIQIYPKGKLLNKLGIAKSKAGTLYTTSTNTSDMETENRLKINYACCDEVL